MNTESLLRKIHYDRYLYNYLSRSDIFNLSESTENIFNLFYSAGEKSQKDLMKSFTYEKINSLDELRLNEKTVMIYVKNENGYSSFVCEIDLLQNFVFGIFRIFNDVTGIFITTRNLNDKIYKLDHYDYDEGYKNDITKYKQLIIKKQTKSKNEDLDKTTPLVFLNEEHKILQN